MQTVRYALIHNVEIIISVTIPTYLRIIYIQIVVIFVYLAILNVRMSDLLSIRFSSISNRVFS